MSAKRKVTYAPTNEFRIESVVEVLGRAGPPSREKIAQWRAEVESERQRMREERAWSRMIRQLWRDD
jgi:hypothetical protein